MLGVAGMGMMPLAVFLSESGDEVVGYDDCLTKEIRDILRASSVKIEDYPKVDLDGFDELVFSSAIRTDHALIQLAKSLDLNIFRRGEKMSQICGGKKLLGIVGSHGKTTSSAMIVHTLKKMEVPISYCIGGLLNQEDKKVPFFPGHYCSKSDWMVAELDESDGTIDGFTPEILVILNLDHDHTEHYSSIIELQETFNQLVSRTQSTVLVNESCKNWLRVGNREFIYFSDSEISYQETNRIAALKVCNSVFNLDLSSEILLDFKGVKRRNSVLFDNEKIQVIEDYAHHPKELAVFLQGFRPSQDLWIVFQPHRYSRTMAFKEEFVSVLSSYSQVYLLPVYGANEELQGQEVDHEFQSAFSNCKEVPKCPDCVEELVHDLSQSFKEDSNKKTILFLGAGDIEHWARIFLLSLKNQEGNETLWEQYIKSELSLDTVVHGNFSMAKKTTLRVGGNARFYIEPKSLHDLKWVLQVSKFFKYSVFMFGRGSNLIVSDLGFDGVVIRLNKGDWNSISRVGKDKVFAGAGVRLKELCSKAAQFGLEGFEFLEGIPGSLGGSLRMNAGAMGFWIFDIVKTVYFLDSEGKTRVLDHKLFNVEYRKCKELVDGIALGAVLKSTGFGDPDGIRDQMTKLSFHRKSSQPKEPSAGCIFKNPPNGHAGKLIDELGLKGTSVGGAEISNTHGNFIINNGNASSEDVLKLVKKVRDHILEMRGIELEPEALLIGDSWESIL